MKKIYRVALAASVALFTFGCAGGPTPATEVNEVTACSVKANGIEKVLAHAETYNAIAVKNGVEYTRLGMKNRTLIAETKKALASGGKMVQYTNKKGKPTKEKRSVAYSAERACKFAISALKQEAEAKSEWRLAVPGDGYKY